MKSFLEKILGFFARFFLKTDLTNLKQKYRDDPSLSRMVSHFNFLHEKIFVPNFNHVEIHAGDLSHLKELSEKGTLVFVMKTRGQLEYSFLNHRFLKEGLPLVQLAPGLRTLFWRPFGEIFGLVLGKLGCWMEDQGLQQRGRTQGAAPTSHAGITQKILGYQNILLHLKPSRAFFFGIEEKPAPFLEPLMEASARSEKPVFIIPVEYFYGRHPEKEEKSWFDLLFGEKSNPGTFRKFFLFLWNYRTPAFVQLGSAIELKEFLNEGEKTAGDLYTHLLKSLSIERKKIMGPVLKPPAYFLDKMLADSSFNLELQKILDEKKVEKDGLILDVKKIFNEITSNINYTFIDFCDHVIRFLLNHVFEGLEMDEAGLQKIKKAAGNHPIVLVPTHKSHIDYLLVSYIFYNHHLTLPQVCSGVNLNFWPVGRFLRKGGAFFMRRRFSGDKLYKLVFGTYVSNLITEGFTIEFFMEGGRSRTGKMLLPKTGFLSLVTNTFWEKKVDDICFVPVNIHYEQVLEGKAYAREMLGAEKKKESARDLLSIFKIFKNKYGKVFVNFGEPVMMKEFVGAHPLPSPPSSRGRGQEGEREEMGEVDKRQIITDLSVHLTDEINRVALVTATSLVATVLLAHRKKSISEKTLLDECLFLKKYLLTRGAILSGVLKHEGTWPFEEAVDKLVIQKIVSKHNDFEGNFFTVGEKKRLELDYYKNNSLQHFVTLTAFLKTDGDKEKYDEILNLLSQEFVFSREKKDEEFESARAFCEEEDLSPHPNPLWFDYHSPSRAEVEGPQGEREISIVGSFLDNFLESLYVTLLFCKHKNFEKVPLSVLEKQVVEEGRALYTRGTLFYIEALSFYNIRQALLFCVDSGAIVKDGANAGPVIEDKVKTWLTLVSSILRI